MNNISILKNETWFQPFCDLEVEIDKSSPSGTIYYIEKGLYSVNRLCLLLVPISRIAMLPCSDVLRLVLIDSNSSRYNLTVNLISVQMNILILLQATTMSIISNYYSDKRPKSSVTIGRFIPNYTKQEG